MSTWSLGKCTVDEYQQIYDITALSIFLFVSFCRYSEMSFVCFSDDVVSANETAWFVIKCYVGCRPNLCFIRVPMFL